MTLLGKYELHEQIGRGGFGTVYRATDTSLKRDIALKILHPQLTTDLNFLEKFRNEARIIAALDNPHIMTIYDLGEAEGRVFIAMKYMPGGSLEKRLKQGNAIPYKESLKIFTQICEGLQVAHEQGLIHRDIKPANILFDGEGNAILSDFGLAKAMQQSSMSAASSAGGVGTPAYRAPELWRGSPPASPATDVYSLGCVLYEMLTGKILFDGSTPDEIITQHLVDGPQLPKHFSVDVPEGMHTVISKALAKSPDDRFISAGDFSKTLGRVSENQTIEPFVSSSANKQTRKSNKLWIPITAVCVLTFGLFYFDNRNSGSNNSSQVIYEETATVAAPTEIESSVEDQAAEVQAAEVPVSSSNNEAAVNSNSSAAAVENSSGCTNIGEFVSETIPDGTIYKKGAEFTKTWIVKNAGTCTWNSNYHLVYEDGDSMSGSKNASLGQNVEPGEEIEISLDLTAPYSNGRYKGYWQLQSDEGEDFFKLDAMIIIGSPKTYK